MNWLAKILGVDAPANTTMQSAELGFRGLWSVGAILLVVATTLAIVGVTFLLYFMERGRLGPIRRIFLALVRVTVLLFLLLLLMRPILLVEFAGERPRPIAVLLDDTKSMQQIDKRTNPADQIRVAIAKGLIPPKTSIFQTAVLADIENKKIADPPRVELMNDVIANDKIELLEGLQKRGPVRVFLFGEQLRSELAEAGPAGKKKDFAGQLKKHLTAGQNKTALGDGLTKLVSQPGVDLPAAIVVMTDGLNNSGNTLLLEAAQECANAKVPLYIYGVGSSEGGTLQLIDVASQGTLFYDDIVTVPIRWRAQGFKKGTVQIKVMLGDREMASKELTVKNGQDLRDALTFTPRKSDKFADDKMDLKVSIRLKENDQYKDEIKKPVRLSDSKVKILYIENVPRWEFKFLQPMLLRDRRVQADFILVEGDPRLIKNKPFLPNFPKREDLLKYDLVILGDVPASYLGKQRLDLLKEFVRDFRGGLLVIAGRQHNPSSYSDTGLAEVLPVDFLPAKFKIDSEDRPVAYLPQLTRAGEMADMLALSDDPKENLVIWRNLPGFFWHYPVTQLRPAATALLVHPYQKMGKQPMPILAQHYYGKGEVLFMATDETWRWRYNVEGKYFDRFWGQIIYKLALPHLLGNSSQQARLSIERSEAILNREGYLYARLLDEEFRPLTKAEIVADIEYKDAAPGQPRVDKVTFQLIPGRSGEYRLFRKHPHPGRFDVRFRLPNEGINQSFAYRVKLPPRHELEEAGLDEETLKQAARITGGRFYREEDLHSLVDDVKEKKTRFTLHQEILLWNPLVFLLFVGLISTEWLVRKFANLS